ncbi:Glyoxylase, beta-lactamase superfamily II [Sporobacter termitidis DSM 10068]|uniref:Glyoxylase, beta-lactamase superfamily II n=1 Tax=Sporobacter termitidis DSM 10068 TaxID=1123282 RepID=A0A1M5Z468_9FIRM|nr:MBL fold metallo-hydrolase [Sporobacter termitidis]SHI19076.1 Glyoxylase, beta-lactamase superfamily II [Sporobacter termitidis DSM 10068]
MLIKTLVVGQIETNCYIVTDEKTLLCAVIDPGDESNAILDYIESNQLKARAIFLTHGHFDHRLAVYTVSEETGAPVFIHKNDAVTGEAYDQFKLPANEQVRFYAEGDELDVGGLRFTVLETPGHSPGSVTLRCENALFTGDTLFRDSAGRTDLGEGNVQKLLRSLNRLADLTGDFEVYPGHMDATTLDRERRFNGYMKYAREEFGGR